ncbi:MAG: prenyltransferase [Bacteroidota bacterium]
MDKTNNFTIKEWIIIWLKAVRAPFLIMSLLPVVLGGIIAYSNQNFNLLFWVLVLVGVLLAHSAADLFDDFYDFRTGNDGSKEHKFHDNPLFKGQISIKQVLTAAILCTVIASFIGVYLLVEVGMPVFYLMLGGAFILFFYTAPPFRLNYHGLGEIVIFLSFGPMIILGTYYVITGDLHLEPLIISIAPGIFTMNVGLISNIFDYDDDIKHNKKSIPVRFGRQNGVNVLIGGTILAYVSIIIGMIIGWLPYSCGLAFLGVPFALGAIKNAKQYDDHTHLIPARLNAIKLASVTSVLLSVGYVIELLFYNS